MAGRGAEKLAKRHFVRVEICCITLLLAFNIHTISAYSLSRFYSATYLWLDWNKDVPNATGSGFTRLRVEQEHVNPEHGTTAFKTMMKSTDCSLGTHAKCSSNILVRYFYFTS